MSTARTILLIEDEVDIRLIVSKALARVNGWNVETASSGPEGLEKAESGKFEVILLDVRMPGMDGPTTFLKLREAARSPEVPVIFLTANTQAHDVSRFLQMGAAGVIPKPFDPRQIGSQISALMGWS